MATSRFVDRQGRERGRVRTTKAPLYDLELMRPAERRAFIESWRRGTALTEWAKTIYPDRPLHFRRTAKLLWTMAKRLEMYPERPNIEALYAQLPGWAQWRQRFNIRAGFPELFNKPAQTKRVRKNP